MKKILIRVGFAYLGLVILFFLLMTFACSIPTSWLMPNLKSSFETLSEEGLDYRIFNVFFYKLDNFTDALMLNSALSVDSDHPIQSAMRNTYCLVNNDRHSIIDAANCLIENSGEELKKVDYSRYWHGYQVFLRPLLCFMDYNGIRIFQYVSFFLLLSLLLLLIYVRYNKNVSVSLFLSLCLINVFIVPLSIQFSTVFFITFLSILFMLVFNKFMHKSYGSLCFFFCIGGITSFFDLLTVPLITLGLPLIVYLSCIDNGDKWKSLFSISLFWLLGYSAIWVSKWFLSYLIIDYSILDDAVQQVAFRVSTSYDGFDMSIAGIIGYLVHYLNYHGLIGLGITFLSIVVVFIGILVICWKKIKVDSYLLFIALFPAFWCHILRNHSIIHCWFVWRVFVISIFAVLLLLLSFYRKRIN